MPYVFLLYMPSILNIYSRKHLLIYFLSSYDIDEVAEWRYVERNSVRGTKI